MRISSKLLLTINKCNKVSSVMCQDFWYQMLQTMFQGEDGNFSLENIQKWPSTSATKSMVPAATDYDFIGSKPYRASPVLMSPDRMKGSTDPALQPQQGVPPLLIWLIHWPIRESDVLSLPIRNQGFIENRINGLELNPSGTWVTNHKLNSI